MDSAKTDAEWIAYWRDRALTAEAALADAWEQGHLTPRPEGHWERSPDAFGGIFVPGRAVNPYAEPTLI